MKWLHCTESRGQGGGLRLEVAGHRYCLAQVSVAESQTVDVSGDQVDALRADIGFLCRHVAVAAVADGLTNRVGDTLTGGLVQPGVVGQVGCAESLVTGTTGTMAGSTHRTKDGSTLLGQLGIVLKP